MVNHSKPQVYQCLHRMIILEPGCFMNIKRLPYGVSNYKTIVQGNYVYVDKTAYIEKLENYHSPFLFFLRPRRFGKSLFMTVLQHYYDISEKDNFDTLFGNTYIGGHPTKERNGYYILNFDFTGVTTDTKEQLEESFKNITKIAFDTFISKYGLSVQYLQQGSAANMLESFLADAGQKVDRPIYIIIDEYDHFANELLSFQLELFRQSVSHTGFVRKWYEVLKKATKTIVNKIFATGVSPITLDSLTSGFNIAKNITRNELFHEMMGFTEEEVRGLVKAVAKSEINGREMDNLLDILKKNYNGYLFSENAGRRLFNSDMILYYLQDYVEFGRGPDDLIDENIASDYGKLGKMFELKNKDGNMEVLDRILKEEEIITQITKQFSMEKDFSQDDFKSLLYYLGLLTIDKKILDSVSLKTPNYAIKGLYYQYYVKKLEEEMDYAIDTSDIKAAIRQIALEGSNDRLVAILEKTLNKLSNRDYIKFDEKYVKLLLFSYCILSNVYMVKSEYEVENGYIDIALLRREPIEPAYFGIFEIKYIRQNEYRKQGQSLVEQKLHEAVKQIEKYNTSLELAKLPNLKKWVLVFAGDECVKNIEIQ